MLLDLAIIGAIAAINFGSGGSFWSFFWWSLLLGGFLIFIEWIIISTKCDGRLQRPELVSRVEETHGLAWEMCINLEMLITTTAWKQRRIDPGQRVLELHWAAVRRSRQLDADEADAHRASAHSSLKDLAQETLARVAAERASLATVAENLVEIRRSAMRLDMADAERDRQEQAAKARKAEERELRARLTNSSVTAATSDTIGRADASTGLAAEADQVAKWLDEADRLLRS